MVITCNDFYEQLKNLIPNLPDETIDIDIHMPLNGCVEFTVRAYVLDSNNTPIIEGDCEVLETKIYNLVEKKDTDNEAQETN